MNRIVTALVLAFATTVASVPAFAGEHGQDGRTQTVFPMKADAFQQKIDARLSKAKTRLEKRIVDKKLDAQKAQELRNRFDARAQKVRAAAAEAEKDGTVTKEEAKTVRQAAGFHHHRHAKKDGQDRSRQRDAK